MILNVLGPHGNVPPDAVSVVWFRDDLRLADNPALAAAVASGRRVLALFVLDAESPSIRPPGGAARWWLHQSLVALGAALAEKGVPLLFAKGAAGPLVTAIARAAGAGAVFWNRRYGVAEQAVDSGVKADLRRAGIAANSYNAHLMREPWDIVSQAGQPMKVYTPFWRAFLAKGDVPAALPAPAVINGGVWPDAATALGLPLDALRLLPVKPDWAGGLRETWTPGEAGAAARLADFLSGAFAGYDEKRNRPDVEATSRLSPHLRFGEIGPRQIWHATVMAFEARRTGASDKDYETFRKELVWREFSYHLLGQFPALATRNFQPKFDAFPWLTDDAAFARWTKGQTGIPIIDAGMRQLWQTGWMHNRVRMIVGSFLVKNLLIDWRRGEEWFWDTLVDADPASNTASWQWVAGSGADAAPYFRVFNPVLQGERFDPDGTYVKAFVPELAGLNAKFVHKPWLAPHPLLAGAGIRPGTTYPRPVVELDTSRDRALAAFRTLSRGQGDGEA
jgi:deoxyribodipyrimidine photo-lyase